MKSMILLNVLLSAIVPVNSLEATDEMLIRKGLETHDRALHIKDGGIRDPYIILTPDGYYYLTGTTPLPSDPHRLDQSYNTGLGKTSIVGYKMSLWRSPDLVHWEDLGTAFFNANVPPLTREQARGRDLSETAQTINPQGVTIVPLDVAVHSDGRIDTRARDPDYAHPGPDEAQNFKR